MIDSAASRDTFRIRDFLAHNQIPFSWTDLESEPHRIYQAFPYRLFSHVRQTPA